MKYCIIKLEEMILGWFFKICCLYWICLCELKIKLKKVLCIILKWLYNKNKYGLLNC